jgi:TusE/DsrC/DsvC family sulfur relay protein
MEGPRRRASAAARDLSARWAPAGEVDMGELFGISIVARAHVDDDGYLMPLEKWDRGVAWLIARGLVPGGLSQEHWKVVDYLRSYYVRFGMVPPIRKLSRDTGLRLSRIYKLFPTGVAKGACRIAGIPGALFGHPIACLYP